MFEVDPDRVVSGAARYPRDVGGARAANTEGCNRQSPTEALHDASRDEPGSLIILHGVVHSPIVGTIPYILQYKIAITFDTMLISWKFAAFVISSRSRRN